MTFTHTSQNTVELTSDGYLLATYNRASLTPNPGAFGKVVSVNIFGKPTRTIWSGDEEVFRSTILIKVERSASEIIDGLDHALPYRDDHHDAQEN